MEKLKINYIKIQVNRKYAAIRSEFRARRIRNIGVSTNANRNGFSLLPQVAAFSPQDISHVMSLPDFVQNAHVPDFNQLEITDIVKELQVPNVETFKKVVEDAYSVDNPLTDHYSLEYFLREYSFLYLV